MRLEIDLPDSLAKRLQGAVDWRRHVALAIREWVLTHQHEFPPPEQAVPISQPTEQYKSLTFIVLGAELREWRRLAKECNMILDDCVCRALSEFRGEPTSVDGAVHPLDMLNEKGVTEYVGSVPARVNLPWDTLRRGEHCRAALRLYFSKLGKTSAVPQE